MKVLIDTNILLDVLVARLPHAEGSARVLAVIESALVTGVVGATSVTTVFYLGSSATPRSPPPPRRSHRWALCRSAILHRGASAQPPRDRRAGCRCPATRGSTAGHRRIGWMVDVSLATFAVTVGALLSFGRSRGGAFGAFETVGQRVTREIALPHWGEVVTGLIVHAGQCVAIGAMAALLLGATRIESRIRTALLVVLAWELAARVGWLAFVRADVVAGLSFWPRVLLALLIGAAVAIAPRAPRENAAAPR